MPIFDDVSVHTTGKVVFTGTHLTHLGNSAVGRSAFTADLIRQRLLSVQKTRRVQRGERPRPRTATLAHRVHGPTARVGIVAVQ